MTTTANTDTLAGPFTATSAPLIDLDRPQPWTFRRFFQWCWANLCVRLKGGRLVGGVTDGMWMTTYKIVTQRRKLKMKWTVDSAMDFSDQAKIDLSDAIGEVFADMQSLMAKDYYEPIAEKAKLCEIVVGTRPPAAIEEYEMAVMVLGFNLAMSGSSSVTRKPVIAEFVPQVREAWAKLSESERRDARTRRRARIWLSRCSKLIDEAHKAVRRRKLKDDALKVYTLKHEIRPLHHYVSKVIPPSDRLPIVRCDA